MCCLAQEESSAPEERLHMELESKISPLHCDLDLAHFLQPDLLRWKAGLLCRLTACYRFHEVKKVQSDSDLFLVVAKRIQPAVVSNSLLSHLLKIHKVASKSTLETKLASGSIPGLSTVYYLQTL